MTYLHLNKDKNWIPSKEMAETIRIFELKTKCFDEIFDFLQLKDLCAISESCDHLKKISGQYFLQNYKSKAVTIQMMDAQICECVDGLHTNLGQYAYEVQIYEEKIEIFKYIASNMNQNLKSIQFGLLTTTHPEYIKEILSKVESVTFIFCLVGGQTYDQVLKYCSKLKCLSISDSEDSRTQWPKKSYPTLEELTVIDNSDEPFDGLKRFLKLNRQLKKLTTSMNRDQLFPILKEAGLKLDELCLEIHDFDKRKAEATRDTLNTLRRNGSFKRARLICYSGNQLVNIIDIVQGIKGLIAIEFVHCVYSGSLNNAMNNVAIALATLKSLEELRFQHCEISLPQADTVTKSLINLERVYLERNTIEIATVFANRLPKLKFIKIGIDSYPNEICISDLQNARKKLQNAQKLTIYLPEATYLDFKWTTRCLKYELVEIKRNTTLDPI